jgi:hypothetical protein
MKKDNFPTSLANPPIKCQQENLYRRRQRRWEKTLAVLGICPRSLKGVCWYNGGGISGFWVSASCGNCPHIGIRKSTDENF